LVEAVEAGDAGVFTRHVSDFDRMTKLDSWKTTILLRIKKQIAEEPSLT
jgi:alpha-soluble NSF attachment protein